MTLISSSYKKLFICDVLKEVNRIKRFHQRTSYTVDDGTGTLDCILWQNEPAIQGKIMDLKEDLNTGCSELSVDFKVCAQSLLKKAEASTIIEEELYTHGDMMHCLGNVKIFRGNPKLDIHHHSKESDVNAESLWMLDVLITKKAALEM